MKKSFSIFYFGVISILIGFTQDIPLGGIVVEQNSKYRTGKITYINRANVRSGSLSTTSDRRGTFQLIFSDRPAGDHIRLSARKQGLEVVNKKELGKVVLGQRGPFKIVMADVGKLAAAQIAYMEIAEDAIYRDHNRKIALLEKEGEEREAFIAELEKRASKEILGLQDAKHFLERQLEKTLELAETYTQEIAAVNLDDASERYIRAYQAFERGQMDSVLLILNLEEVRQDVVDLGEEVRRIQKLEGELERRKANVILKRKDIVESNLLAGKTAIFAGEDQKALAYYKLAVEADSANFEALHKLCKLLVLQDKSHTILPYAQKMRAVSIGTEETSFALLYLGIALNEHNQLDEAITVQLEAIALYKELAKEDSQRFEPNVAHTSVNLGVSYKNLNQISKAISSYEEALQIYRKLYDENPQGIGPYLATTINNLGVCYEKLQRYDEAVSQYKETLELYRKLSKDNPQRFEPYIARTLHNLGIAYGGLKKYEKAISIYEEAIALRKKLFKDNPQRFASLLANSIKSLGLAYSNLGRKEEGISAIEEAIELYKSIPKDYFWRFKPDLADAFLDLGLVHFNHNQYEKAILVYKEALAIYRKLAEDNPQGFKSSVASTLNGLGYLLNMSNHHADAISAYKEALGLYTELRNDHPQRHVANEVSTLRNIITVYFAQHQYQEAYKHQKMIVNRMEKLHLDFPQNKYYQSSLPNDYFNLSWYALFIQSFEEAELAARQTLKLNPKLITVNTNLAMALLFQGKEEEANSIFHEWAPKAFDNNRTYAPVFLDDLKLLEEAGISHPLVEKAREILQEYIN